MDSRPSLATRFAVQGQTAIFGEHVKTLASTSLVFVVLIFSACGGGGSPSFSANGPLSGNWQLNLLQNYPPPSTPLSVSGFFLESDNTLSGSLQGPTIIDPSGTVSCAGVGQVIGTISSQQIAFSLNIGGTVFNFTGTVSSDNTTMSGNYQALNGPCFTKPTTGTWSASLIPPLTGTFTGTLSDSQYMQTLTGSNPAAPIAVSGTLTQTPNVGGNIASLSGTITAVGYPCFATASMTGTISGNTVLLSLYGYNGNLIGSIGLASPAVVTAASTGLSLTTGVNGLSLGPVNSDILTLGPCPIIQGNTDDEATVAFTFQ